MGRRRTAVYVFGTGEPIVSDCPGKGNRTRAERKGKRPQSPRSDQTEGEAGAEQQREAAKGIIAPRRAGRRAGGGRDGL